jgi:hypothetical protein
MKGLISVIALALAFVTPAPAVAAEPMRQPRAGVFQANDAVLALGDAQIDYNNIALAKAALAQYAAISAFCDNSPTQLLRSRTAIRHDVQLRHVTKRHFRFSLFAATDKATTQMLRMIKDVIIHEIGLLGEGAPSPRVSKASARRQPGNTRRRD